MAISMKKCSKNVTNFNLCDLVLHMYLCAALTRFSRQSSSISLQTSKSPSRYLKKCPSLQKNKSCGMLMIKYQKRMIHKKDWGFFVGFENDLLLRIIGPQSSHKARPWWIQNAPWWSMATLLALRNHLPSSELTRQWIFFPLLC